MEIWSATKMSSATIEMQVKVIIKKIAKTMQLRLAAKASHQLIFKM